MGRRRRDRIQAMPHPAPSTTGRAPVSPLVGRSRDVEALTELLEDVDVRLVTLVGPAGVGKTRLALELARVLGPRYEDGVHIVELAEVVDVTGVAPAILRQLGGADAGADDPVAQIAATLGDRRGLLLLDNFEQVVEAAPAVADLLGSCEGLRIVVTSRRPLRVRPERVVLVEPLEVPDFEGTPASALLGSAAIELLVERMRAADSTFSPSSDVAPALADVCRRVDGLPLAIELVAPRIRVLPVAAIAAAMEPRLPHLVRGPLDSPQRHRTMRDALAWSYGLLDPPSARLLRHVSVFAGGWSLEAARALAPEADAVEILDLHEDLVMHSLVKRDETSGDVRYQMLEVVREFALERLEAAGERVRAEQRHAEYFLGVAERQMAVGDADLGSALTHLERERANLHAAGRRAVERGTAEVALRLCIALRMLWYVRGSQSEGRALCAAALALPGAPPATRARALAEASALARQHGDFVGAGGVADEAVRIARECAGQGRLLAYALLQRGFAAHLQEEAAIARACLEESVDIARVEGDDLAMARGLHHLGFVAMHCDADVAGAAPLHERSLEIFRALGNRRHVATALVATSQVELARRRHRAAWVAVREAMAIISGLGDLPLLTYALRNAAAIAGDEHRHERALRLLGAVDRVERLTGAAPWPAMTRMSRHWLSTAVHAVGERRAAALRRQGAGMTVAAAVAYATSTEVSAPEPALSRRELEVAALVAEGLTNREIAGRLTISERTVDGHVARVLSKLELRSRAQIATWVTVEGLTADPGG